MERFWSPLKPVRAELLLLRKTSYVSNTYLQASHNVSYSTVKNNHFPLVCCSGHTNGEKNEV